MSMLNKRSLPLIALLAGILGMVACSKKDYLTDGGLNKAITPLSNYDYLNSNADHYFDTTILIIDHFNLKDSVNKAGTFFAFTDFSVNRLMTNLQVTSLDQLYDSITSKVVTQYLFTDSITLNNVSAAVKPYTNWADTIAGINKLSASYYTQNTTFSYFVLQYTRINGYLDGSAGAPVDDKPDAISTCQTTGIKTSSGATTLHILSNAALISVR